MNNRVIVCVVNLGIETAGKAHVSLQQCVATVVGEKIVFSQTKLSTSTAIPTIRPQ